MTAVAAPPVLDVYAACYDLGARFFLDGPAAVCRERLPALDWLFDALRDIDANSPVRLEALLCCEDQAAELERAESIYTRSVVLPIPGRYVPPYASVHLGEQALWGASTSEVQQLYAEYGLEWQKGCTRAGPLAPDHLGLELAFLALAHSAAGIHPGKERPDRLASFLDEHLLGWLPCYLTALHAAHADALITEWVEWLISVAQRDLYRLR